MIPVQAFKCREADHAHDLWCVKCGPLYRGVGRAAADKVRRLAVAHVTKTGHEVRADTTKQRGWRPREDSP